MTSIQQKITDNLRNRAYPVNSLTAIHGTYSDETMAQSLQMLEGLVENGTIRKSFIDGMYPMYKLNVNYSA